MGKTTGSAKDREAIRKLHADFAAAWERDDAEGMAACWAADGDLVNPFGRVAKGRRAVEQLFAEERSGFVKSAQFASRVEAIRFLKPDVAIVDVFWLITGAHAADGTELEPLKGTYAAVTCKSKGRWGVSACRGRIPTRAPA